MTATKMSGANALLETLERQGVKEVFGILGGAILPVYDALYNTHKYGIYSPDTNKAQPTRLMATHAPRTDHAYALPPLFICRALYRLRYVEFHGGKLK